MTAESLTPILCVDDEQNVLDGLSRTLRSSYSIHTALGGPNGLEALKTMGPFAVLISDMRMPGMSGAEFLSAARQIAPDSVRVLLTGYADVQETIAAVNDGNIFRFLTKPCPSDVLLETLLACCEQYRLINSERVLLEQTLHGSIKALTNILALSNPAGFSRATRVQQSISQLMTHFKISKTWPIEVAAMLSQIGYVTLPLVTQEKLYCGESLTADEKAMCERVPRITEELIAEIPRLDMVREVLRLYNRPFKDDMAAPLHLSGAEIAWGARALKICIDYDLLMSGKYASRAFEMLRSRAGCYDPAILEVFADFRGKQHSEVKVKDLTMREIVIGMVFGEDVRLPNGLLLIGFGQEVTPSVLERIRNFSPSMGIREPIRMMVK